MSLSRHNDDLLDNMKTFAGEQSLLRLQDKLKISDAFQGTLQEKLSALEKLLTHMSEEQLSLKEAAANRLSKYESAVGDARMKHAELRLELSKTAEELESCKAALRQKEKHQQALEEAAQQQTEASAAERENLMSLIDVCKGDLQSASAALEEQQGLLAQQRVEADANETVLQKEIQGLNRKLEEVCSQYEKAKAVLKILESSTEDEKKELKAQLDYKDKALIEKEETTQELRRSLQDAQHRLESAEKAGAEAKAECLSRTEELEQKKESWVSASATKEAEIERLKCEAQSAMASLEGCKEEVSCLRAQLSEYKQHSELALKQCNAELKEQETRYWHEKEKLKKLQEDFAEQYEAMTRGHAKDLKLLQAQAEQQLQAIAQHESDAQAKSEEISSLQAAVARLEAARITTSAMHGAQLEEAVAASEALIAKERTLSADSEKQRLEEKAALEAELLRVKMTVTEAESRYNDVAAEQRRAAISHAAELAELKEKAAQREAALQAEAEASAKAQKEAMNQLREATEVAAKSMAEENQGLSDHVEELDAKLADTLKRLSAKEESLEALRGQARMREHRLAELARDVEAKEELLKCISSAAATVNKTPVKPKPRGMPPPSPIQSSRYHEEPYGRKRAGGSKKRKMVTQPIDENFPTQEQGIETLKLHQQQQKRLAMKVAGRKSGRTFLSSMSAEPVQQQLNTKSAALGLFGSDIAHPY